MELCNFYCVVVIFAIPICFDYLTELQGSIVYESKGINIGIC